MKELRVKACAENLNKVFEYLNTVFEKYPATEKIRMQVELSVDELFTNIASYAYPKGSEGDVIIYANVHEGAHFLEIKLIDDGIAFNPLERDDPDVELPIEERSIGGLGIFLVKQNMDEVEYRYEDEKNIMMLRKDF